jgi:hypothetical protein
MNPAALDRTAVSIGTFADEPDDRAYWLGRAPEERIAAIEFLRRQFFAYGKIRPEFRRVLEIAERPRR